MFFSWNEKSEKKKVRMEATRTSVTSGNEQIGYNMDPAYQVGYTQQEVDGKSLKWFVFFKFDVNIYTYA